MLSPPGQYPDERVSLVTDIRGTSYGSSRWIPGDFTLQQRDYVRGDDVQGPGAGSRAHGLPTGERGEQMQRLNGRSLFPQTGGVSDAPHPYR